MESEATIRDIMSHPVFPLSPEQSVRAAAGSLSRRGVSGAPVCDAAGRLVGVVSRGDLTECWLGNSAGAHTRVIDVMTRDVVTATPGEKLQPVAERMVFEGVHRVVVVDDQGFPVGMITPLDVLRAVVAAGPLHARSTASSEASFPSWPAPASSPRRP